MPSKPHPTATAGKERTMRKAFQGRRPATDSWWLGKSREELNELAQAERDRMNAGASASLALTMRQWED